MESKQTGWIMTACFTLAGAFCVAPAHGDTVHASADTNINLAAPDQVNGSGAALFIRNSGAGGERHAFLRFDLSVLPPGVPVSKVTLRLWVSSVNDEGPVDIHTVLSPWDEATLSASTAPLLGPLLGSVDFSAADQNHFITADITTLVQGWLDGSIEEFGIALVPTSVDPVRITLDSKEATGTSHAPELEVTPVGPEGPAGPPGPVGVQGDAGPAGAVGPVGPQGPAGNLALAGQSCPEGQFVTGFDSLGDLICGPAPAPIATIADDFEGGLAATWRTVSFGSNTENVAWSIVVDGTQVLEATGGNTAGGGNSVAYRSDFEGADFAVSSEVKIHEIFNAGHHSAIVGRFRDVGNFYELHVNRVSNTIILHKWEGGIAVNLGDRSLPPGVLDSPITLKLELVGNQLRGYLDEELLIQVLDTTHASGSAGFMNAGGTTRFDNFRVENR